MAKGNYTSRTLDFLRKQNFKADMVERWIPGVMIRKDLFGIIDIVAISKGVTVGVQSTSYQQAKKHRMKIWTSLNSLWWLRAGNQLWLLTWKRCKIKRGGVAYKYAPVLEVITEEQLMEWHEIGSKSDFPAMGEVVLVCFINSDGKPRRQFVKLGADLAWYSESGDGIPKTDVAVAWCQPNWPGGVHEL